MNGRQYDAAEAGRRLKLYVLRAIMEHPDITGVRELCRRASITPNTIYSWFAGTSMPTTHKLSEVALALDRDVSDLWEAYENRDGLPPTLEEKLAAIADALDGQTEALSRLIAKLEAVADDSLVASVERALSPGERRQAREARQFAERRASSDSTPRPTRDRRATPGR